MPPASIRIVDWDKLTLCAASQPHVIANEKTSFENPDFGVKRRGNL